MKTDIITHYNLLIDENNDPVNDPKPLQDYMNKWDGELFIDALQLDKNKTVLEIGIGTGRLAIKVAPFCKRFTGIDISPKTIERAKQHLGKYKTVTLICGDYLSHVINTKFDLIYSSLTWFHFQNKQAAMDNTADLLNDNGRFVLSINKDRTDVIDYGTRKLQIFPDKSGDMELQIKSSGLTLVQSFETEKAYIFVAQK